jgi:transcriptional regulator with XRE-family HTH domain
MPDDLFQPAQSRMARAALTWPIETAAEAAGVSSRTVLRFEKGQRDIKPELIRSLRQAYEAADVRFVEEDGRVGVIGPRLRPLPRSAGRA